jgi:hypothetical protein
MMTSAGLCVPALLVLAAPTSALFVPTPSAPSRAGVIHCRGDPQQPSGLANLFGKALFTNGETAAQARTAKARTDAEGESPRAGANADLEKAGHAPRGLTTTLLAAAGKLAGQATPVVAQASQMVGEVAGKAVAAAGKAASAAAAPLAEEMLSHAGKAASAAATAAVKTAAELAAEAEKRAVQVERSLT